MIDTLIIIGNGFDIWQGLNTSYASFERFYKDHIEDILKKLHLRKRTVVDEQGNRFLYSDVELVYGNPFNPEELSHDFWGSFEISLENVNAEMLNLYFGKDRSGLKSMKRSIRNAKRILQEAFCEWIQSIEIEKKDSGYTFGDNCLILNFNYTETALKRFHIKPGNEHHVHGEATDKKSIVFGHSMHPYTPEESLKSFGGRFRGLYYVDQLLYETDKHVEDNIQLICMFIASHGVMTEDIKNVYVLGQSMSLPDISYFEFLARCTLANSATMADEDISNSTDEQIDSLEEFHNRLQYIINRVGYHVDESNIPQEYKEAIQRKYETEQYERSNMMQKWFLKRVTRGTSKRKLATEIERIDKPVRTEDAKWHISFYTEKDRAWKEKVMSEMCYKNYKLYPSIEECIESFKD